MKACAVDNHVHKLTSFSSVVLFSYHHPFPSSFSCVDNNGSPTICRSEMYAGHVTCCPWWVTVEYADETDRHTDRQTVTSRFPLGAASVTKKNQDGSNIIRQGGVLPIDITSIWYGWWRYRGARLARRRQRVVVTIKLKNTPTHIHGLLYRNVDGQLKQVFFYRRTPALSPCEQQGRASTSYKRRSKCTMEKVAGRFLQELTGGVHKFPL